MGCMTSKQAVSVTPAFDHSGALRDNGGGGVRSGRSRVGSGGLGLGLDMDLKQVKKRGTTESGGSELGESGKATLNGGTGTGSGSESVSFGFGNLQKHAEGEQVAAGWPSWLSAVAGEAIHGWVPLRAESFEKLEKVFYYYFSLVG